MDLCDLYLKETNVKYYYLYLVNVTIDIRIHSILMMWISFFAQKEVLLNATPVHILDAQLMLQKTYQISHF